MPRRDPETGKYVSGSAENWDENEVFVGSVGGTIPAADLAGGSTSEWVTGDDVILIDFSGELDRDEVFELRQLQLTATLSMPTTATGEGAAQMEYALRTGLSGAELLRTPTFYSGQSQGSSGIVDLTTQSSEDTSALAVGRLTATNSIADSVNGLAAGGDDDRERRTLHYGRGPHLDEDDEILAPFSLHVDNVSNHAVVGTIDVLVAGVVYET